jgi:hypothetical protein
MPSPEVTALIERSIRNHLVLRVTYRASNGTVATHKAEALAIRFNQSGHRVLWCWSRDAEHIEELLWDGIEDAVDTGETFAPRPWDEPQGAETAADR